MRKLLMLLLPLALIFTSCNLFNDFGKKFKPNDKNEVYYKGEGITEADAKKLADYLLKSGYFNPEKGATVQVTKEDSNYHVRFVYDKSVYDKNKGQIGMVFWFLQDQLAENVFNYKKVSISLADEKLKDFETIEEMNKVEIEANKVYYKGKDIKQTDAKFIGDSLIAAKFFDYTTGDILLTKEKGHYLIRFIPNEQVQQEKGSDFGIILENYKYIIGKYILNGEEIDLITMDGELKDTKEISEPTAERKVLIDQAMTGLVTEQETEMQHQTSVEDLGDDR